MRILSAVKFIITMNDVITKLIKRAEYRLIIFTERIKFALPQITQMSSVFLICNYIQCVFERDLQIFQILQTV